MLRATLKLFSTLVLLAFAACGGVTTQSRNTPPPPTSTSTSTSTSTDTSPYLFQVQVSTQWESSSTGTSTATSVGSCQVDASASATASQVQGGTLVNCPPISIPEIQLYYSKLIFSVNVAPSSCTLVTFNPYFYRISLSTAYAPPGATSGENCSLSGITTTPTSCFGGAGVVAIPNFPTNNGTYFVIGDGQALSQSWTIPSANTQRQSGNTFEFMDNRWTSNDLVDRSQPIRNSFGTDVFAGGAENYQDWSFVCTDAHDNLYRMVLTITPDFGKYKDFYDWTPSFWQCLDGGNPALCP